MQINGNKPQETYKMDTISFLISKKLDSFGIKKIIIW